MWSLHVVAEEEHAPSSPSEGNHTSTHIRAYIHRAAPHSMLFHSSRNTEARHGRTADLPSLVCLSSVCVAFLQLGSTAVGVCTKQGVILAVEKRISSPLLEPARY